MFEEENFDQIFDEFDMLGSALDLLGVLILRCFRFLTKNQVLKIEKNLKILRNFCEDFDEDIGKKIVYFESLFKLRNSEHLQSLRLHRRLILRTQSLIKYKRYLKLEEEEFLKQFLDHFEKVLDKFIELHED